MHNGIVEVILGVGITEEVVLCVERVVAGCVEANDAVWLLKKPFEL
jgi:hypothetical protein